MIKNTMEGKAEAGSMTYGLNLLARTQIVFNDESRFNFRKPLRLHLLLFL